MWRARAAARIAQASSPITYVPRGNRGSAGKPFTERVTESTRQPARHFFPASPHEARVAATERRVVMRSPANSSAWASLARDHRRRTTWRRGKPDDRFETIQCPWTSRDPWLRPTAGIAEPEWPAHVSELLKRARWARRRSTGRTLQDMDSPPMGRARQGGRTDPPRRLTRWSGWVSGEYRLYTLGDALAAVFIGALVARVLVIEQLVDRLLYLESAIEDVDDSEPRPSTLTTRSPVPLLHSDANFSSSNN